MGLSFHYKGTIRNITHIDNLTEEMRDICQSLDWKYHIWGKRKNDFEVNDSVNLKYTPDDLKGISISPYECESLFLTFLPNGDLCSPVKLMLYNSATNDLTIEVIHIKTQFAGTDTHITLMKLLRYLKEKYFTELEVDDEGLYWETGNENILLSQFAKYNIALKTVKEALSDFNSKPGETVTSLADRLEEFLQIKLGRKE